MEVGRPSLRVTQPGSGWAGGTSVAFVHLTRNPPSLVPAAPGPAASPCPHPRPGSVPGPSAQFISLIERLILGAHLTQVCPACISSGSFACLFVFWSRGEKLDRQNVGLLESSAATGGWEVSPDVDSSGPMPWLKQPGSATPELHPPPVFGLWESIHPFGKAVLRPVRGELLEPQSRHSDRGSPPSQFCRVQSLFSPVERRRKLKALGTDVDPEDAPVEWVGEGDAGEADRQAPPHPHSLPRPTPHPPQRAGARPALPTRVLLGGPVAQSWCGACRRRAS